MDTTYLRAVVVSLLCVFACVSVTGFRTIPSLGQYPKLTTRILKAEKSRVLNRSGINYYTQTIDHFNYKPESYLTFRQKYIINSTYWAGAHASAPIFVTLGDESPLDPEHLIDDGFAARFNGLMVAIEHRYYGESIPFGSRHEAFKNSSTLGYFSSTQAIADYAEIILYIKKKLYAKNCPVIVMGGSYSGMLATWFRLKYPHIVIGALASSAPILYFDGISPQEGYYAIVSKVFMDTSMSCYNTIRRSWDIIDNIATRSNGLSTLSKMFKTCVPLSTSLDLKSYLDDLYSTAAQYNLYPNYILSKICNAIDGAPEGTSVLGRVVAGHELLMGLMIGNVSCYNTSMHNAVFEDGYGWQMCTEMVMPIGYDMAATMFQYSPFNLSKFSESCHKKYGVEPRAHWATTEFGGQDITHVLAKFGSNIIFSNGLRDPYSSGGVLQNISDSIVALTTANGSHCNDIINDLPTVPEWIAKQRASEMEIMGKWIVDYHKVHRKKVYRKSVHWDKVHRKKVLRNKIHPKNNHRNKVHRNKSKLIEIQGVENQQW